VLVAAIPEAGTIAQFVGFGAFDPQGNAPEVGLGNLPHSINPLEALGVWPSGDFRLDAGAGFAPTAVFWLGGLVALAALAYGLAWWLRRGERAVPAALAAAAILYLYPLVAGTPYQEAKAIAIAAPLAMLISVRALFTATPPLAGLRRAAPRAFAVPALAVAFALPAAACSVLALANGPVGPADWTADLIELRESGELGPGGEDGLDTLVIAPEEVLVDQHGEDLFLWELRGGRVCASEPGSAAEHRPAIENIVRYYGEGRFAPDEFRIVRTRGAETECPFIADGDRADPGD
jgi:hypothetical protein